VQGDRLFFSFFLFFCDTRPETLRSNVHKTEAPYYNGVYCARGACLSWISRLAGPQNPRGVLFQVSSSSTWIPDGRLYKGLRIHLVSLRVCSGPQQTRLFSSYMAAQRLLAVISIRMLILSRSVTFYCVLLCLVCVCVCVFPYMVVLLDYARIYKNKST